ncbi:MAG: hypothetical protein AABW82_01590 [Nanoarchaeota archaeon]|mgnify:CR=1 FL=1
MARKTPQTSLKNSQNDLYLNSRANLGSNSEILIQAGDIATNRGYSHQTRIAKIGALLKEGQDTFTAGEKQYAQSLLNNSQSYLQNQAEKGRIKNYSIVKDAITGLKDNIQAKTSYLNPQPENVVQVKFTPSPQTMETRQPAKGLETIVVPADFTPSTTPANITPVSFLGRTRNNLAKLAAIGTLAAITAYGLLGVSCKPGPDPKGKLIAQLQAEKAELQSETNRLGDTVSNLHSNYDATMSELMTLKTNYADATNTSHNLSTNLAALTTQYNLATNDLATTSNNLATLTKEHSLATNDLVKAEVKLTGLQADLGSSIIRNVEMTNKLGSANLKILSASNDLFTATNQLASVRRDYGNATNQVAELKGYLSTAKKDLTKAQESTRKREEQLAREMNLHVETGTKLQRTTGTLEATTRNYVDALERNKTLSANLTASARELAVANSTLQDRLREVNQFRRDYSTATNKNNTLASSLTNTVNNLREATGKYNAMAHLQGETAHKLNETKTQLANLTGKYTRATNLLNIADTDLKAKNDRLADTQAQLGNANRTISKYHAVEEAARLAEERRVQEGKTVDKLISVSPLELPLSVARFSKDGKRLQNIQEVPYYGDGFVDTFSELRSFARAIGNTYQPTNNDAIIPIWFGKTKLSNTETATVLREIPTSDLKRLGTFLENASTNAGSITFTNDTGVFTIGSTKRLRAILGAKK